jgi:hypothetical protein
MEEGSQTELNQEEGENSTTETTTGCANLCKLINHLNVLKPGHLNPMIFRREEQRKIKSK